MSETPAEPFVGPQPFGPAHTLYGRDLEISELRYYLGAKRIVLLSSPSGAGKSSLLKAKNGLLAKLRASERFDVWGDARVNQSPAGSQPGNRFSQSLIQSWSPKSPAGLTLPAYAAQRTFTRSPLLVIDQFEEVLRLDPANTRAKHEFFDELSELLGDPRVWALFVIREDYLAALTPYLRQLPTHLHHQYRIDFLRREDQALAAFAQPLAERGRHFADGVAEGVLRDLAKVRGEAEPAQHVEPLQIQVVGQNLWRKIQSWPEDRRIEIGDVGDVTNALAQYYNHRVQRPDADLERAVRLWVGEQLINPAGYRNLVRQEPEQTAGLPQTQIDALCDAYLVRRESRAGATWLELAHDRLVEPVRVSNADWNAKMLSPLQRAAELWGDNQRQEGFLLAGKALTDAENESRARRQQGKTVTAEESAFLAASTAQRTRGRWKRAAVAGLVALLLASLGAGWFAWQKQREAESESAKVKQGLARFQLQNVARLTAANQPASALAYLAESLRLGGPSADAEFWAGAILQRGNPRIPFAEISLSHGPIRTLAVSADGRWIAAANGPGEVKVWSVPEHRIVGESFRSEWGVKQMSFDPKGDRLLVLPVHQEDFSGYVWDWRSGKQLFRLPQTLQQAAFSADGQVIETLSFPDDQRERFRADTGERLGKGVEAIRQASELTRQGEEFADVNVRLLLRGEPVVATGGGLAAHAVGDRVWLSRLAPAPHVELDFDAPIDGTVFTASGDLLVATEKGVWRVKPDGTREAMLPHRPAGRTLGFSAGGQWLVEPHRLWNLSSGRPLDLPPAISGEPDPRFPPLWTPSRFAFNEAGDSMAIITTGSVTLWRLAEGKAPERVWRRANPQRSGGQGSFGSVAFRPAGGQVLVWGGWTIDGPTRPQVWSAADGKTLHALKSTLTMGDGNTQFLAAYSSQGTRIAVASPYAPDIEIFDADSGQLVGKSLRQDLDVKGLAFGYGLLSLGAARPGQTFGTSSPDWQLRTWDPTTGTPGGPPWRGPESANRREANRLTLAPGDRRVAVIGHRLTLVPVTPEIRGPAEAQAVANLAEAVCGCALKDELLVDLNWSERQRRLQAAAAVPGVRALVERFSRPGASDPGSRRE